MDGKKGLIFDIQGQSVHDGPGSRTLVFLTGCYLRCQWCANPEGMLPGQKIRYFAKKCKYNHLNCKRCLEACPKNAIKETGDKERPLIIDRNICKECQTHDCVKACYHDSIIVCSEWKTVDEVMKILNRDRFYWGDVGGVTFSGGEPFYQVEFLKELVKRCKNAYIHTAIETSAHVNTETFLDVMKNIDFAFIDIKHMDSDKHKEKTGVGNELILKNISELAKSDWKGRLVLRTPIIKDYNDNEENMHKTADFMDANGLYEINILPFHPYGESKWEQLGLEYPYSNVKAYPEEGLKKLQQIFLNRSIACYTGSDTPF